MTTTRTASGYLPTENEAWGFYGTWTTAGMDRDLPMTADEAWDRAVEMFVDRADGNTIEGARDWLDSRFGRHYADAVVDAIRTGTPVEEAFRVSWIGRRWRFGTYGG